MKPTTKTCPICGTRFAPFGRQRYDKPECRAKAYRRRKKATSKLPILRPCKQCSKPFPPVSGNQLYCSEPCAKAADNSRQRDRKRAEQAAREILRHRKAGELRDAEFKAAAERLGVTTGGLTDPNRKPTQAERSIQQALYDEEATRRAQIPRREPPGFDPADYFLPPEPPQPQGQGPSIAYMRRLRDGQEAENG